MEVKCNLPYPEIRVEGKNIEYAKLLMEIYAGKISEDTAIHLYIFEHLSLEKKYEYYAKILVQIAIVEMKHLNILGELIKLLGIEPEFMSYDNKNNILIPWNSRYVNYKFNIKDMIDVNIKEEEETIKYYTYLIGVIKDKYIVNIINRIILDEKIHLKIFTDFKNELNKK